MCLHFCGKYNSAVETRQSLVRRRAQKYCRHQHDGFVPCIGGTYCYNSMMVVISYNGQQCTCYTFTDYHIIILSWAHIIVWCDKLLYYTTVVCCSTYYYYNVRAQCTGRQWSLSHNTHTNHRRDLWPSVGLDNAPTV